MLNNSEIMSRGANASYELVPVEKLKIDKYQRLLNLNLGCTIAKEFSFNKVGVITVSLREGQYNVIDGQHRLYGATLAKVPQLMCQVLNGLSYQSEAKLFNDLNGIRKKVNVYDIYNADIEAGDADTLDIKKCVESAGLKIFRGTGDFKISSIANIRNIYKKGGYAHLSKTLMYLFDTWEGISSSLTGQMIKGMSAFLTTYGSEVDYDIFIKQLRLIEPYKIKREIDSDTSNLIFAKKYCNVVIKYYNLRLHYENRINIL